MRIQTYRDESLSRHFDLIYGGARQYRAQSLANFTAQQLSDLLPSEMVTTTALMTGAKYPAFCLRLEGRRSAATPAAGNTDWNRLPPPLLMRPARS
jgi:hypothetical protein